MNTSGSGYDLVLEIVAAVVIEPELSVTQLRFISNYWVGPRPRGMTSFGLHSAALRKPKRSGEAKEGT
jgi:hypothetical protein